MINDWEITHERHDLPAARLAVHQGQGLPRHDHPEAVRRPRLLARSAHSAVVMKLSTRSNALGVIGDGAQFARAGRAAAALRHRASRRTTTCRASPRARKSPASRSPAPRRARTPPSIPDFGVVCKGTWQGKEVLGMRVTWDKRYITLGPVATLLGLAFRLYDPGKPAGRRKRISASPAPSSRPTRRASTSAGATCRSTPCSRTARTRARTCSCRSTGSSAAPDYAGKGWMMLMGCLAAGRSISLPTSSVGGAKALTRITGAYARVRSQFKTPIGKLEGVEEALGRIAAQLLHDGRDARHDRGRGRPRREARGALGDRQVPHDRARARDASNDAMDIHGGKGICLGPNNWLGRGYQVAPVGDHGRGRQHPHAHADHLRPGRDPLPSLRAARDARGEGDDRRRRIASSSTTRSPRTSATCSRNGVRAFVHGLTSARLAPRAARLRAGDAALLPLRLAPVGGLRLPRRRVDAGDGRRAQAQGEDLRAPGRRAVDAVPRLGHAQALRGPGPHQARTCR